jgi:hypothetical protein
VDIERRNVCTDPVHEAAESCPWFERLARWTGSMDRRKVSCVERLGRQHRIAIHQRRTPDSHHDLLGHRIDRYVVPALLRLFERGRRDLGEGRHQELDRIMQGAGSVCALSQRYQSSPTRMGKPILRCTALDRDAQGRTFRRHGRAGVAGSGHSRMVPCISPLTPPKSQSGLQRFNVVS